MRSFWTMVFAAALIAFTAVGIYGLARRKSRAMRVYALLVMLVWGVTFAVAAVRYI
jgi:ABC-type transport system involved in cytochrome c biogenesis permease subunit